MRRPQNKSRDVPESRVQRRVRMDVKKVDAEVVNVSNSLSLSISGERTSKVLMLKTFLRVGSSSFIAGIARDTDLNAYSMLA